MQRERKRSVKIIYSTYATVGVATLILVGQAIGSLPVGAQKPLVICGTYNPTQAEVRAMESAFQRFASPELGTNSSAPRGGIALSSVINIDVYYHIITKANGTTGDIGDNQLVALTNVLNDSFAGKLTLPKGVTPLGPNANTPFRFTLKGIDRTANDTWYTDGNTRAMKAALRKGDAKTLNVYLCSIIPNGLVGYAVFPSWYKGDPIGDGVVYDNTSLPGGSGGYTSGRVLAHEVGHWAGLYHTFQGSCEKYNDFVTDTAAEAAPFRGNWFPGGDPGVLPDTCKGRNFPGSDPADNMMDYSADASRVRFTEGQANRMLTQCRFFRGL